MIKKVLFASFLLLLFFTKLFGQQVYRVERGERPPIDYSRLNEDAWEAGVLIVKFSVELEQHLDLNIPKPDKDGIITFNVEGIDKLNKSFGVRSVRQHFASEAFSDGFTDRHKAWGFHLWYRFEFDAKQDIPAMLKQFDKLKEIDVVEPAFRKVLVETVGDIDFIPVKPTEVNQTVYAQEEPWFPNDEHFGQYQWHYYNTGSYDGTPGADISLPAAWSLETGNDEVIVAIIDGGIDFTHPDLQGSNWSEFGYNFVDDNTVIVPDNHGTHVGGTVGAVSNNEIGVAGVAGGSGSADGVRLMSLQVFHPIEQGDGFHLAPIFAADNDAAISQNSWSYYYSGVYEQNALDAIDYFNVNGGGDVLVDGGISIFATGNSNSQGEFYPAFYSGTFSVSATNNKDIRAYYSNYGDWVDISAPGGETNIEGPRGVLSTMVPDDEGHMYAFYMGTSMACPHVSGIAALILSKYPGQFNPQNIKDILTNSADNIYHVNPSFIGKLGWGRANAYQALIYAGIYHTLPEPPANIEVISYGEDFIEINWSLNSDQDSVMLVYSPIGVIGRPENGIVYQPGDNLPGGGVVAMVGDVVGFLHQNLTTATSYMYRLYSVNQNHAYSSALNIIAKTTCAAIELPYIQKFNSTEFPDCWSHSPSVGNWYLETSWGNPAPSVRFNSAPMLFNYNYAFETPVFIGDISGSEITLQFDLNLERGVPPLSTVEYLTVQVFDGNNWVDVMQFDNITSNIPWNTYSVDITEFALGHDFGVRFTAHGEDSYNIWFWGIDNVIVYASSCNFPENIEVIEKTAHSALIGWDEDISVDLWNLKYGQPGFDPYWSGTAVHDVSGNSFLIEGLSPWTEYDVYVQSHCAEGDQSLWTGPLNFKTMPTCPEPVSLQANEITGNSALINWEPVGEEEEWILNWGLTGFNPNNAGILVSGITEAQYSLDNLEGNTVYDVYVRAYCSADDVSFWQGPVTFDTPCGVVELPYVQNFDDDTRLCWSFPEGQGNWKFAENFAPPSSVSGPPHAVFTWNPIVTNYSHSITSPVLYAPNNHEEVAMDFILFFNSHSHATIERISLEYKLLDAGSWSLLQSYSNAGMGNANVEHITEEMIIPNVAGQYFQIRFRAHGINSFNANGRSIDDLVIYQITEESCFKPSDLYADQITTNSAEISWTPGGDESGWEILWGHEGFDHQSAGSLITNINAIPYLLENLEHSSSYDVYLRAVCNNGLFSELVGPVTFTTETPWYDVVVIVNPEEGGVVSGYGTFMHGHDVTLTATPADNYVFVSWEESGQQYSTDLQINFVLEEDRSFIANFQLAVFVNELVDNWLTIYPNPASRHINIYSSIKINTLEVFNITGQMVKSHQVNKNSYLMDATSLQEDVYVVRILLVNNEIITRRLLIVR